MKPYTSNVPHKSLGTVRYDPMDCILQLRVRRRDSILRDSLPPQPRIVLAFVDPPDVIRAVGRLAYEVPAGAEECGCRLHLGRSLAGAASTHSLP